MTKEQRARSVGWLVHVVVVHSGRHRQRGVRFAGRGSRWDAARQAAAPGSCRSSGSGVVMLPLAVTPDTNELPSPIGYTRYKNAYMADGSVWA